MSNLLMCFQQVCLASDAPDTNTNMFFGQWLSAMTGCNAKLTSHPRCLCMEAMWEGGFGGACSLRWCVRMCFVKPDFEVQTHEQLSKVQTSLGARWGLLRRLRALRLRVAGMARGGCEVVTVAGGVGCGGDLSIFPKSRELTFV